MQNPIARACRRGRQLLFRPAARYPADPRAVFVLALSVFSGLTALALEAAPASLEALLPAWAVFGWGALLAGGSALTLAGMLFQSLGGILVEQVGSVVVGAATVFYSLVILTVVGADAVQGIGIILAWGLSCFFRWGQLQALINHAHRTELRRKVERELAP